MNLDYVGLGSALIGIKNGELSSSCIEKQLDLLRVKHEDLYNKVLEEFSMARGYFAIIEVLMGVTNKKERK
jgi:hypothetical protein